MTIYLELTREFNAGRPRTVLCSGQACVLHRLAIASKDGAWILREDEEALEHVLGVLARRGARYRFGAPLDVRWMSGGWSAHLEFPDEDVRVRTDFFTRPPRVSEAELRSLWQRPDVPEPAFTDARLTAQMKMTDRERDWAFVGELARLLPDPRDELRYSRSPRDIQRLAREHPALVRELVRERPLLAFVDAGSERLDEELDRERRAAMRLNVQRLSAYGDAARAWASAWPAVERATRALSLREAHRVVVAEALSCLPTALSARPSP